MDVRLVRSQPSRGNQIGVRYGDPHNDYGEECDKHSRPEPQRHPRSHLLPAHVAPEHPGRAGDRVARAGAETEE